jgi:lipopolysaccharide export system ATP-binding protein
MIVGLIKPNEGQIFLQNDEGAITELTKLPVYRRAQLGVGYLAQEASVFRRLSVEDNIRAVLEMTSYSKEYQRDRLESLIEEFRLQKVRKSLGIQLSGGERRRTEIARAVAINPSFILLDEPFAGVDPIAVEDIQSIVATLKNKNIGVIITDHNVDETLAITDRTYLLYEGKILKTGTAEDLANDEVVRRVYLGKNFQLRKTAVIETLDQKEPLADTPTEPIEPEVEPTEQKVEPAELQTEQTEPIAQPQAEPTLEQNNTEDNG